MKNYIVFTAFVLFWLVVGFMIGYSIGEIETMKNIDPETCVSVCAEEFERFGC